MINKQLINLSSPASSGGNAEAEQGLILHLDANDVDSYDGDGTEWVDISTFEKTIPLSDNEVDLEIHYDPSDINSYSGTGTTMTNLAGSSLDATVVAAEFDTDNGGFFDVSIVAQNTINVPNGHPLDGTGNSFTLEFWFNWISAPSLAERFIYEPDTGWNFFYYGGNGWRINNADCATGYFANNVASTAGEWNHFAMSQDASNCRVYINGTLVKTQAVTSGTRNIDSFSFGSTSLDGVNCKIGSIRMYSAALSASDIGQNYRHGRDTVYTDLIPDTSLELHLDADSFDGSTETPSTWTDSSANSNNGTISGATFDSELGNLLDFDGADDYVSTSYIIDATNDYTFEGWFNQDVAEGIITWGMYNGSTIKQIYGGIESDGDVRLGSDSGAYHLLSTSQPITVGKWHHISWVYKPSTNVRKIYVDGEQVASSTSSWTRQAGGIGLFLAARNTAGTPAGHFDGKIGQFRVYESALTQDQIRQNYNFTKPSYPNGFDATINGATWNAGGYFQFDGSNDYIDLTASSPFGTSTTQSDTLKSFTGWVKLDAGTRAMIYAASSTASSDDYFTLQVRNTSPYVFIQARDGSSSNQFLDITSYIPDTNWHHYVFQVTDTTREIYIDGVKKTLSKDNRGTATDSSWVSYPSYSTSVKHEIQRGRVVSPYYGSGKMSKVKYYDKALTQAEITALYNEGQ